MTALTRWRPPTREEFPVGMAELAKIIGEREAVDPSWTRRLALDEGGTTWLLVVESCAENRQGFAPWTDPVLTQAFPLAYPLAEGVALLQGKDNPEDELKRRRQQVKEHAEQQARDLAARIAAEKAQRERDEQLAEDKLTYQAARWEKLEPWQRAFLTLALKVKPRDPALAADLHAVAEKSYLDFPRAQWWRP